MEKETLAYKVLQPNIYNSLPHVCLPAEWKGDRKAKESEAAVNHSRIKAYSPRCECLTVRVSRCLLTFLTFFSSYFFNKPQLNDH